MLTSQVVAPWRVDRGDRLESVDERARGRHVVLLASQRPQTPSPPTNQLDESLGIFLTAQPEDSADLERMARYLLHAPLSLKRLRFDDETGTLSDHGKHQRKPRAAGTSDDPGDFLARLLMHVRGRPGPNRDCTPCATWAPPRASHGRNAARFSTRRTSLLRRRPQRDTSTPHLPSNAAA